jgi:hypothetical protein
VTGVPQLLQNLAVGAGRLGGVTPGGRVALAVADVAAPHLLQNTPLTGDPHLLQKFAMVCSLLSSLTRVKVRSERGRTPVRPLRIDLTNKLFIKTARGGQCEASRERSQGNCSLSLH